MYAALREMAKTKQTFTTVMCGRFMELIVKTLALRSIRLVRMMNNKLSVPTMQTTTPPIWPNMTRTSRKGMTAPRIQRMGSFEDEDALQGTLPVEWKAKQNIAAFRQRRGFVAPKPRESTSSSKDGTRGRRKGDTRSENQTQGITPT